MSVSIFFHSDPVTVEHYAGTKGFIAIKSGEATVWIGGEGEACAVNAMFLACELTNAANALRAALAEKEKVA